MPDLDHWTQIALSAIWNEQVELCIANSSITGYTYDLTSTEQTKDAQLSTENTRDLNAIISNSINSVPGNSYQEKLDFLSLCNCCEKHQVNKPFMFEPWNETPINLDKPENLTCHCNCRHIARYICRQAD